MSVFQPDLDQTINVIQKENSTIAWKKKMLLTARNICSRVVDAEIPMKHARAFPSSNGHLSPVHPQTRHMNQSIFFTSCLWQAQILNAPYGVCA
jgi:hypothetical protein